MLIREEFMHSKDPYPKFCWWSLPQTEVCVEVSTLRSSNKHVPISQTITKDEQVELLTIGKKGNDILRKEYTVVDNQSAVFDELNFENVAEIAENLMQLFADGTYDKIEIVYNSFKNAATQIVKVEQFLPIKPAENTAAVSLDYIFEPAQEEIVSALIPKSLKTQLFKALRDSFASEHGARMTAMHKATDNANDLRNDLLLTYNKARQAAITNEILEIVGGAEALNG